jgi:DNA-binding MarR family transcriptional regulator/GNAT superfamily N-acetyltransferase
MADAIADDQIAAVRAFNRFYTRKLGVLEQQLLHSPFSLAEARVLYELAQRSDPLAKEIGAELGLDAGYLSRMLQNFHDKGLISRKPSADDRRQTRLALTAKGRAAFAGLERRSREQVAQMLAELPEAARGHALRAMATTMRLLGGVPAPPPRAILRAPRPGEIGWVVQSHGASYAAEYGFDASFEALVAEVAASFLRSFDAARERCWIAEIDDAPVGSVFLVRHSDEVAKLRLLLVEPAGRGQRLGQRLVGECIGFARQAGYRRITLWTQSILIAARKIYQDHGFIRVTSEPHHSFGQDLIGETWELEL